MAHSLFFRGASLSLAVFLLLPSLAAAAGSAPLGTMRSEGAVFVDASPVPVQSSLFSGDRIATTEGRASVTLSHGSSILIGRASDAALRNSSAGLTVGLNKGKVTLHSAPKAPIQVETAGLTFMSASKFPSFAEVAMLPNGSVSLSVHRGAIAVRSARGEAAVFQAGRTVTLVPQPAQQSQTPGTAAHGSKTLGQAAQGFHLSHTASVVLIGAAVAATAAAIAIPLATQEDEPVSPAVP